jgi:hypothetical protein
VAGDLATAQSDWTELGLIGDDRDIDSPLSIPRSDVPRGGEPRRRSYDLAGFAFDLSGAEAKVLDHLEGALEPFAASLDGPRCSIEIDTAQPPEPFVLRVNGAETLRTARTAEMIGAVFQFMLTQVHPETEWLALVHGAAVRSPDGRAVLLPGDGGSGKSTLAAWLSRRGFGLLAGDMIALDAAGRVVPWPLPHSIKRGSWAALASVMTELEALPSRIANGREMKFVPAPPAAWQAAPTPVAALIFPAYGTRDEPGMTRLTLLDTVERLFDGRMWLGERLTSENVEAFLRWLEPIPAYAMGYSMLDRAEDCVRAAIA